MKFVRFFVSLLLVCCFLSALYVPMEMKASAATSTKFSAMLARAEALCNYEWVPTSNIYTWNGNSYKGRNYFKKGETVKGYAFFDAKAGMPIVIDFDMKPFFVGANPKVAFDCGKYAVQNGPIVYCMESYDNGEKWQDKLNEACEILEEYLSLRKRAGYGEFENWYKEDTKVHVVRRLLAARELLEKNS